jgi:hypothetical protein
MKTIKFSPGVELRHNDVVLRPYWTLSDRQHTIDIQDADAIKFARRLSKLGELVSMYRDLAVRESCVTTGNERVLVELFVSDARFVVASVLPAKPREP